MGSGFMPFEVAGRTILRLGREDLPVLQRLLERSGDYFDMVAGQPAGPNEAEEEFTAGPPERFPQDQFCLGIPDARPGELARLLGVPRCYPADSCGLRQPVFIEYEKDLTPLP
jgi:hypothetical protein